MRKEDGVQDASNQKVGRKDFGQDEGVQDTERAWRHGVSSEAGVLSSAGRAVGDFWAACISCRTGGLGYCSYTDASPPTETDT